jgi:hypothetical protein
MCVGTGSGERADERLVPDLPRGRGRSIGGDLNIGKEGSEQTSWPNQEGLSLQVQPTTQARIGRNATKFADE